MNIKNLKNVGVVPMSVAFVVVVAAVVAVALMVSPSNAEDTKKDKETTKSSQAKTDDKKTDKKQAATPAVYTYEAQAGDSYSKIARKAIQTYGLKYDVKLSGAQIIFAETNLTLEADSPELTVGQTVSVEEADVKAWVEKARDLSDEKKSAWEAYTVGVDFDTDSVGETR